MKKSFFSIVALILTVLTVISLVSCININPDSFIDSIIPQKFKRGIIDGTKYSSEFAEIVFTKPGSWSFYSDEQLVDLLGATKDWLNSDNFNKVAEAETIDFYASSNRGENNVTLSVSKGSAFANFEKSIEKSVEEVTKQFTSLGLKVRQTSTGDVTIAGQEFRRVTLAITTEKGTITEYLYVRMAKNHFISIAASTTSGKSSSFFEEMFSPYGVAPEEHKVYKRSTQTDISSLSSTISNLKITVPSGWTFKDDDAICQTYNITPDSLNEKTFEEKAEGMIVDFQAVSLTNQSCITMLVYKGEPYTNAEEVIDNSLSVLVNTYSHGYAGKPSTSTIKNKKLGNEDFKCGTFNFYGVRSDYLCAYYAKAVNDYLVVYIFETNGNETPIKEFEPMFSSIESDQAK